MFGELKVQFKWSSIVCLRKVANPLHNRQLYMPVQCDWNEYKYQCILRNNNDVNKFDTFVAYNPYKQKRKHELRIKFLV